MTENGIETNIEQKPFKEFLISKPELDLSFEAEIKRKQIKKRISSFNSHPNTKAKYLTFVKQTETIIKNGNDYKQSIDPFKTIQIKDEPTPNQTSTIPKLLLSYCTPYDYHHSKPNKKNKKKQKKPRFIQSANFFQTVHFPMKTEDTNYEDVKNNPLSLYQKILPHQQNKALSRVRISLQAKEMKNYFDSELIAKIAKEKETIDKTIKRIKDIQAKNERDDNNNNASSDVTFHNNYHQLKMKKKRRVKNSVMSHNSSRFKSLDFKKECIFNKEYNTIYSNKSKMKSHHLFIPPSVSINDNNISQQFNSISRNLKTINKTMIQDKKYSQKVLRQELKKRNRKDYPERALINQEIKQAKFTAVEIDSKGLKEKVAVNILGHLKEVLQIKTKKEQDPLAKTLDSTIVKFCQKGNFDVFIRNKAKKSNYLWRLKQNGEEHCKIRKAFKTIEDNNFKIKYIQRKIKSIQICD